MYKLSKRELVTRLEENGFIRMEFDIDDGFAVPNFYFISTNTGLRLDTFLLKLGLKPVELTDHGFKWTEYKDGKGKHLIGHRSGKIDKGFYLNT